MLLDRRQTNDASCPIPPGSQGLGVRGAQHMSLLYAASACLAVVVVLQLIQILSHLARYRVPDQQRQVIRILFAPIVFAVISWTEIYDYYAADYIDPVADLYEALALCALYLLYNSYNHVLDLEAGNDPKQNRALPKGWFWVFQYPVVMVIVILLVDITNAKGIYCRNTLNAQYGHLWSQILGSVGVSCCVFAILKYYSIHKHNWSTKKPMFKLLCFKLIVFLRFVQSWVFSELLNHGNLVGNDSWSYGDYLYGLPNLILAAEMVLFSIAFYFAYPVSEYTSAMHSAGLPFLHAVVDSLDPTDMIKGFARGARSITKLGAKETARETSAPRKARGPIGLVIRAVQQIVVGSSESKAERR